VKYEYSPVTAVKCGVENCHFNDGHVCRANSIEVNAPGDGKAQTCDGTCCSTFVNGNSVK